MSNAALYYSYWRRTMDMSINLNTSIPTFNNPIPDLHVDTEVNQQSNPIVTEATYADNNVMDDYSKGVSVYA